MAQIKKFRGVFLMVLCALLVFMTLLTVRPQVTYACSCVVPAPPLEAMENSTAVFEGTVISIKKPSGLLQSSADPEQVTFQVGARWKGEVGEQLTLSTAQSSDSCGFEFTEGERYLVYARGEADGGGEKGNEESGGLTTSLCSRTAEYVHAQEDLNELGPGNGGLSPTEPPDLVEGGGTKVTPPDVAEGDGAKAIPPDTAERGGSALSESNQSTPPWLLYTGAGVGIIIVIAGLTLLRRRSDKPGK